MAAHEELHDVEPTGTLSPERERAVEELGRRAGSALRRPAPADGVARAMHSAQRRRSARVVAVTGLIVVAAVVGLAISGSGNGRRQRPVTTVDRSPGTGDLSEFQIGQAMLLTADEYAPGWRNDYSTSPMHMQHELAAGVPSCSPFLDDAFEDDTRPATTDYQLFVSVKPPVTLSEYVVVFADDSAAHRMFAAINDPAFLGECVPGYWDALAGEDQRSFPFSRPTAAPSVTAIVGGDEATKRSFVSTQLSTGQRVEQPVKLTAATIRVGRSVVMIETLDEDFLGRPTITPALFRQIVDRLVERASSALGGVALAPRAVTPADSAAPATDAIVIPAVGASPLTVRLADGEPVRSVAISHSGRLALASDSGSAGTHITVVDIGSAMVNDEFDVASRPGALAYSSNSDLMIEGFGIFGSRKTVRPIAGDVTGPAAFSADGSTFVAPTGDTGAAVFGTSTGSRLVALPAGSTTIVDVRFSPDASKVVGVAADSSVRLWDASSGEELGAIETAGSGETYAEINRDGSRLMVSGDGILQLWDIGSGVLVGDLSAAGSGGWGGVFSPDGRWVVGRGDPDTGRLCVWSAATAALVKCFGDGVVGPLSTGSLASGLAATRELDGTAAVRDFGSGERIFVTSGPAVNLAPVLSPEGRRLVTVSGDTASVWTLP